jgi:syntaxin-binding protein 1
MITGLPQFQQGKELYSLHLGMAQECMNVFQRNKLPDIALVEQVFLSLYTFVVANLFFFFFKSMATGLDEDYKKPKNVTDQIVRLLDDEAIPSRDRIRLIIEYVLHRDGIFGSDIEKLLAHAQLPPQDSELIQNMDLLGARVIRQIKESRSAPAALFPKKPPPPPQTQEDVSLSRFEPLVKQMLEDQIKGILDQNIFPYTKPHTDGNEALANQISLQQASLRSARSAKPTWARTRPSTVEPRQRIILFVAGGATYSESRVCYELSRQYSRDVCLATSHMMTPALFLQQVGDLSADRRQLDLPIDKPPRQAPAHIFERDPIPPPTMSSQPPTAGFANMALSSSSSTSIPASSNTTPAKTSKHDHSPSFHVITKPAEKPKEKKRGFFKF